MIQLFNTPNVNIDTSKFSNLLHDKIVKEFEENFCDYVGGKYAVSLNSATNAIFLLFSQFKSQIVYIPSILPPVVANALIHAGCKISFIDETSWVGHSYFMGRRSEDGLSSLPIVIDSAQEVKRHLLRNFNNYAAIYSFYPTKPVGSCDGGMIVTDNYDLAETIRMMSMNGMSFSQNNWEREQHHIGHKMYMNSIQAYIANESLKLLPEKNKRLDEIREQYNDALGLDNKSLHLYRLLLKPEDNNKEFINKAKEQGIVCGIHYEALHTKKLFYETDDLPLPVSEYVSTHTVSMPFHEKLSDEDVKKVINYVKAQGY